jgi:hypothetical protein
MIMGQSYAMGRGESTEKRKSEISERKHGAGSMEQRAKREEQGGDILSAHYS